VRGREEGCAASHRTTTARLWERGREGTRAAVPTPLPSSVSISLLWLLLPALVLLPGCGRSPTTTFFVLSAVRPDTPRRSVVVESIQLRAVHIPDVLDRTERVSALSGDRLQIHQFQQWAAPLADMIRRVLSEDLAARLPGGTVVPPDAPAPAGTRDLVLDIQEFLPESNGQIVLQATWTLLPAATVPRTTASGSALSGSRGRVAGAHDLLGGAGSAARTVLAAGRQRLALPAGAQADAQVTAMSRLLGRLADAIVAGVSRPRSS
jgi:uncharacterized protein